MRILNKLFGILFGIAAAFFLLLTFVSGFDFSLLIIAILFLFLAIYSFKLPSLMQKHRERVSEKRIQTESEPVDEAPVTPAPKPVYTFRVAGVSFREKEIKANLLAVNDFYLLGKQDLIDSGRVDECIFKYANEFDDVALVPDTENKDYPGAIKVVVEGIHVGYVPSANKDKVCELMEGSHTVSARLLGGPFKIVHESFDYDREREVYELEKDELNYGIEVSIE